MSIDLRDQLRGKYGTKNVEGPAAPVDDVEPERAFVLRGDSGRTVITAPVREIAQVNAGFSYLRGRFVEADNPNGNQALWTTEDLELGAPSVAGGPLNWLHQERKIIGTLLDGELVSSDREAADSGGVGNHIVSNAVVWKYLFPNEAMAIEKAAAGVGAFYSMECISRQVACIDAPGRPGCGESFDYRDYDAGKCCSHLREKSSVRRFVDPLFLGGAIIVPPVMPGWAKADVEVMRQAAALTEREGLGDSMEKPEAEAMVAQILQWANR
jgi:hypothetical protein